MIGWHCTELFVHFIALSLSELEVHFISCEMGIESSFDFTEEGGWSSGLVVNTSVRISNCRRGRMATAEHEVSSVRSPMKESAFEKCHAFVYCRV